MTKREEGAYLPGYDTRGQQITLVRQRHKVTEGGHAVGAPGSGVRCGQGCEGPQIVHHAHLGLGEGSDDDDGY